ncbi:MAG: alpha/beta hydrolase family protein [Ferruginibacter sp.]
MYHKIQLPEFKKIPVNFTVIVTFLMLQAYISFAQQNPVPVHYNASFAPADEENLNVLQQWIRWNNPGSLIINHLNSQAFEYYDARDAGIKKLITPGDWLKRQREVREKLSEIMGEFPEKGPLNARITGTVKKEGYRIEKIIYESFPGAYVTGCLYLPEKINKKYPAILNVMGHDQEAYKVELYQIIIANLVKKGMIVLTIDPPGQGEHVQYFDTAVNFSSIGYSVIEHCYFGNQCFISGISPGKYFIWDGIRGIDYLLTRKEVDPERIGLTGFSGGGTITSYIGAFDDRVKVSIPCSWSTSSRRQLEAKGAADAETIFIHGLEKGISFEDLIEVRAPKPTLMTFVSRDQYISYQGAMESYREAKIAYRAFGKEDLLAYAEDDSNHWMTPSIRLAIYAFFMKHFNIAGDPAEEQLDLLTEKELRELKVTPTGQISTSVGGNLIFDLNKKETEKLVNKILSSRKDIGQHLSKARAKAIEISGYVAPVDNKEEPFNNGRYQRSGYSVVKYAINGEGKYAIPVLLFIPNDKTKKYPAIIYVHSTGKITEAKPGGEIEQLVKKGYIVAATDVLGIGETKLTAARSMVDGYTAVLIGRSVVGIQAGDIVRVVNYLKHRNDVDTTRIGGVGINEMCLPMLHAAAFDPSIKFVALVGSLISYRSVAMSRLFSIGVTRRPGADTEYPNEIDFSWGIANVLSAYDLPDLEGCISPRKIAFINVKNAALQSASVELINQDFEFPRAVYASKKAPQNLRILDDGEKLCSIIDWCAE